MRAHNFIDLTGNRFGRLLVLSFDHKDATRTLWWLCLCNCGKTKVVRGYCLTSGMTRSCGCLKIEATKESRTKHGQAGYRHGNKHRPATKEYNSWCDAKHRITNPKNNRWHRYGKIGIKMCNGWFHSFGTFFADMGICPDGLSLHRIDNKGHYSCGHCDECKSNGWALNCKWGTDQEQANSTSRNRYLTFNGRTQTIAQWSREWNTQASYVYTRLYRGWTNEQIFSYFSVDGNQSTPNVTTV